MNSYEKTIQTLHPPKKQHFVPLKVGFLHHKKGRIPDLKKKHPSIFSIYLENKLLLVSINFTPKTCHSCLKKGYVPMFSR